MMSSQSKHCLVDESWGSTRRHDAGYYITTLIPLSVGPAYCMAIRWETYRESSRM